jgi:uncharacterized protein (TIGR00251 family)
LTADEAAALDLAAAAGGTRLRLRVKPGARKMAVLGVHAGALKLSVLAPPERGKANRAALKLLARTLELRTDEIHLLSGASSQDKTVLIAAPPELVRQRLTS